MPTQCLQDPLAAIESALPESDATHWKAARYALLTGGKRLRPRLVLAAATSFGADIQMALPAAIAIELIHTYSLIHDDLPAMDDDDYRRGKPTVHRAFDDATAILAGDALLTYAFEVIVSADLPDQLRLMQLQQLSKAAGGEGMILGQMLDLEAESRKLDVEELRAIHEKKTGALIACAIVCGGMVGGASIHHLRQVGMLAGLAFQIIDDVLDIENPEKKRRSSDLINDKSTYVSLLGLQGAKDEAKRLYTEALQRLKELNPVSDALEQLLVKLVKRTV